MAHRPDHPGHPALPGRLRTVSRRQHLPAAIGRRPHRDAPRSDLGVGVPLRPDLPGRGGDPDGRGATQPDPGRLRQHRRLRGLPQHPGRRGHLDRPRRPGRPGRLAVRYSDVAGVVAPSGPGRIWICGERAPGHHPVRSPHHGRLTVRWSPPPPCHCRHRHHRGGQRVRPVRRAQPAAAARTNFNLGIDTLSVGPAGAPAPVPRPTDPLGGWIRGFDTYHLRAPAHLCPGSSGATCQNLWSRCTPTACSTGPAGGCWTTPRARCGPPRDGCTAARGRGRRGRLPLRLRPRLRRGPAHPGPADRARAPAPPQRVRRLVLRLHPVLELPTSSTRSTPRSRATTSRSTPCPSTPTGRRPTTGTAGSGTARSSPTPRPSCRWARCPRDRRHLEHPLEHRRQRPQAGPAAQTHRRAHPGPVDLLRPARARCGTGAPSPRPSPTSPSSRASRTRAWPSGGWTGAATPRSCRCPGSPPTPGSTTSTPSRWSNQGSGASCWPGSAPPTATPERCTRPGRGPTTPRPSPSPATPGAPGTPWPRRLALTPDEATIGEPYVSDDIGSFLGPPPRPAPDPPDLYDRWVQFGTFQPHHAPALQRRGPAALGVSRSRSRPSPRPSCGCARPSCPTPTPWPPQAHAHRAADGPAALPRLPAPGGGLRPPRASTSTGRRAGGARSPPRATWPTPRCGSRPAAGSTTSPAPPSPDPVAPCPIP